MDMTHASCIIHQAQLDLSLVDLRQFHELKLSALTIFERIDDLEGLGEVFFLQAMLLIIDPS